MIELASHCKPRTAGLFLARETMKKKKQGAENPAEMIRAGLQALASEFAPNESQAYTFALMAQVFYDMEAALDAGATQRAVYAVFTANGVPVPFTRFTQDLTRLRGLFPARKQPPKVEPFTVERIAEGLAVVKRDHEAIAQEAEAQAVAAGVAKIGAARPAAKPRNVRKPKAGTTRAPVMERMQVCADALLELAEKPGADPRAIARRVRASLGYGWTIKTVIQFIVGGQYAEWLAAPWSDVRVRARLATAQAVALRVIGEDRVLPDLAQLAPLASRALKTITQKGG